MPPTIQYTIHQRNVPTEREIGDSIDLTIPRSISSREREKEREERLLKQHVYILDSVYPFGFIIICNRGL